MELMGGLFSKKDLKEIYEESVISESLTLSDFLHISEEFISKNMKVRHISRDFITIENGISSVLIGVYRFKLSDFIQSNRLKTNLIIMIAQSYIPDKECYKFGLKMMNLKKGRFGKYMRKNREFIKNELKNFESSSIYLKCYSYVFGYSFLDSGVIISFMSSDYDDEIDQAIDRVESFLNHKIINDVLNK